MPGDDAVSSTGGDVSQSVGERALPLFLDQSETARVQRAYVRLAAFLRSELDAGDLPTKTASRYRWHLACVESRLELESVQEAR